MSGGAWEYVAGYVNNSYTTSYGKSLVNGEAKTKNVYIKANSDDNTNNYNQNSRKYGEAVYETSTNGSGKTSWFNGSSIFPFGGQPFFNRGGSYGNGSSGGVFYFNYSNGTDYDNCSFRPVLVIL